MSTHKRNWGRENIYIRFHQRGVRLGQSRGRLLTQHWPLNLVHARVRCNACGLHHRTSPIEEQSGNEDRDCCYATDDAASNGPCT